MRSAVTTTPVQNGNNTLVEAELVDSLSWLINMRWFAGIGVLLVTWFSTRVLAVGILPLPLYLLGFAILGYNASFRWGLRRLSEASPHSNQAYQWFARFQIAIDWIAMALLIHFSGGIESPAILYFLFHITIASLLLPHDRGFLYVALGPILVGGVALSEYVGVLPHVYVFQPARYDDPLYVAGVLLFFVSASYVMAYFSMTISRRLRRREDELTALYRSAQATTSTLDLTEVLNRLAEVTTHALGCKGAAIRLLDKTGSRLEIGGAYGLSEDYLDKEPIEVARAPLDQEALSGKTVLVRDALNEPRLRYPEKVAAEGIRSILSTPLRGKQGVIGVLRVYGDRGDGCDEEEVAFLNAIAAQGSVAIENAQTYQMLEELDQAKSQFVRMVSHELRSPVQVSSSLLKVLSKGYVGGLNEEQADLVARAQRRIDFLQTLIDDLLDLAAGKADVMAPGDRHRISLSEVIEEVQTRFEAPAQEKELTLRVECASDELPVWGDKGELDRIVSNLVSNAVKYTQKGEVRVSAERTEGTARVVVADTGIGIPENALPHLFDEFYRAKNARALHETGTGLGLSIVKDLVDLYDGDLAVESTEGEGTTITLSLPLATG